MMVCSGTSVFAADSALLRGKVLNSEGNPVAGAKIVMHDEDSGKTLNGHSDRKGNFEIDHPLCSTLFFEVLPPEKSGLASAYYSHVTGESSQHFIVKLHRGFHISGRILAEGEGVKGLEIIVKGREGEGSGNTIHGGGRTVSRADGEYSLFLTPGKKVLQIKNDVFSNLSPVYQHEFTVTGDMQLPDMSLPLLKTR